MPSSDPVAAFVAAMNAAGIRPTQPIIGDGRRRRVHAEGDRRGTRHVSYRLHTDGVPNGYFRNWRTGVEGRWIERRNGRAFTPDELHRIETTERELEHAILLERARAQQRAQAKWRAAFAPNPEHAYLSRKAVGAHGIKQYGSDLLVPVRNAENEIVGLQRIDPSGGKTFERGTPKNGNFHAIGALPGAERIVIAEGYATAATLHEATGLPVVIAFDSGNLPHVARTIRGLYMTPGAEREGVRLGAEGPV